MIKPEAEKERGTGRGSGKVEGMRDVFEVKVMQWNVKREEVRNVRTKWMEEACKTCKKRPAKERSKTRKGRKR